MFKELIVWRLKYAIILDKILKISLITPILLEKH
jgi:hypothetical protein